MAWKVVAASATGRSHRESGTPCQDAFAFSQAGGSLVAVVCDGAGSALHADEGATTIARQTVAALGARLRDDRLGRDETDWAGILAEAVAAARASLEHLVVGRHGQLRDYACTLVGVMAAPSGGCFFHLGDGVGICEYSDGAVVLSPPENGEYANETWFITDQEWRKRLRVTPFDGGVSAIALMSDGAESFVMDKGGTDLYRPFIDPVVRYLRQVDADQGARALQATLGDARTDAITSDDKTLVIALAS